MRRHIFFLFSNNMLPMRLVSYHYNLEAPDEARFLSCFTFTCVKTFVGHEHIVSSTGPIGTSIPTQLYTCVPKSQSRVEVDTFFTELSCVSLLKTLKFMNSMALCLIFIAAIMIVNLVCVFTMKSARLYDDVDYVSQEYSYY